MRLMLGGGREIALQRNLTNLHFPSDFGALLEKDRKSMLSPLLGFIQHWARYGRVVQKISCLSDRELADIGINRCDIDRIITPVSLRRLRALSALGNFG